ncbi:nicotinate-nucleotide adenylyltransferase [Oceanicoccus sagamiensis]|uniref:Probable nicotinate-nucleotide adenylyltransferase n=1 Tax=Oceanicoccus sagamiensis TaxID=716816 RepID=A0A1X9N9E7_9GAMM|nr:nicotinate-nucleotide adenylyltransferase [Oceanicoccus sagamiensis]ARN74680.1 nicotinic acid mononucleotide adenylyltransferase [Oceanicoccus sagamiensis]
MKSIALFGGTFDPVHNGHIQSATELKQRLSLDELRLVPCHLPVHRASPGCSSEQRLAMVKLAVAGTPLQVDDREMHRNRLSYSVDTLESLRNELGDQVSLSWVMGTDAFAAFDSWHRWQDFLTLAHIIVMQRPGEVLPEAGPVAQLIAQYGTDTVEPLQQQAAGAIRFESLTPYPVSATAIRSALSGQQAAEFKLEHSMAPAVLHYIQTHQLYGYQA